MMKRDTYKACLNQMGIDEFDFDLNQELEGYRYLFGHAVDEKMFNRCKNEEKYSSYGQWKKSIRKKYENRDKEYLQYFSKYLEQRLCNLDSSKTAQNIVGSVLVTLLLDKFFDKILDFKMGDEQMLQGLYSAGKIIIFIIFVIICIIVICALVYNCIDPIWRRGIRGKFLNDYKEIIDTLIEDKNENTSQQSHINRRQSASKAIGKTTKLKVKSQKTKRQALRTRKKIEKEIRQ